MTMYVVARHRHAPLVALSDGSVVDTEDLEVIGSGDVAGGDWDFENPGELDPRWAEIATADATSLGVTERKVPHGSRTFRAPSHVRDELLSLGIDSPLADGKGLTLDELGALCERDEVTGPVEDWMFGILNKHEDNPDAEEELALFSAAEPELDYDEIAAAMDDDGLVAAVEPPPGEFTKVVYLAIIEEDDQKSVQDLVALVSTKDKTAAAFKFGDKGWEESATILTQLQASAPPPIKQLEDWQTESIVAQISSTNELSSESKAQPWEDTPAGTVHAQPENPAGPQETTVQASGFELEESQVLWGPDNKRILAIIAAKGAGRYTGNAQRLRDYWQTGKGGAKLRWGTPGDATRCHRHLSKYLGARAWGYCNLMHKRMTGVYTGSRFNVGGNGR